MNDKKIEDYNNIFEGPFLNMKQKLRIEMVIKPKMKFKI